MSALEELRKRKMKNNSLEEKLSKCQEEHKSKDKESIQIINDLQNQLQEAKKIEEDLDLHLKRRIQDSYKLEKQIIQLRKGIDEKQIKSKFHNSSRILDDILSSQRSSNDKTGVGYDKVKKPEYSSVTNQGGNKRSNVDALKIPITKKESKKFVPSFYDKNITNEVSKRPMTNRYQHIFLGHCYSCNNFVHEALNAELMERFMNIRRICLVNQKE